nr:HNH endonuclease [Butyrivibrio sp. XB500-5]
MANFPKIKKIYSISIEDDLQFQYIVEVINGCFGRNYTSIFSCMNMTFCHIDDDHMVWFPKMASVKNGKTKAPARSKGWVNYLIDDGRTFIEEKADDTRSGAADGDGGLPRYTFGWYADKGYVFLGVFQADASKCRTGHFEFTRVADSIDLRGYHAGESRIILPSPSIIHLNESADDIFVGSFRHSSLSEADSGFEYEGKPRVIKEAVVKDGIKVYPRDRQVAINALAHARYKCEIDNDHPTFIRKNSDKTYTEPHHLIPLAFQDQFDVSLDIEENIVSLCSTCHNEIHYGKDADALIRILFSERIDVLRRAGIDISLDDLLAMYGY